MHRAGVGLVLVALALPLGIACDDDPGAVPPVDSAAADAGVADAGVADAPGDAPASDASASEAGADATADVGAPDSGSADARTSFVAVTFNTGTSEGMAHDAPPADGYTSAHAKLSDLYYGDGLAWIKAVAATKAFFAQLDPDVVVYQEVFYSDECATIPKTAHKDFVCETWKAGDPTVAPAVLGAGWQVACHPGKPDKCAAVKKSFGTFRGCKTDFCLAGLDGYTVTDCGKGARVGRGIIDLVGGGELTLVNVHGSSGIDKDTINCREKQFDQVFKDLGDGKPGASGKRNLVLGDLNTDPGRAALVDNSADRWNKYVGPGKKFHFISQVGLLATPTYAGIFNIDHVVSDVFTGSCWAAGVTTGHPAVINAVYFDHKPLVCTIKIPQP
jgi:hypothetical protein